MQSVAKMAERAAGIRPVNGWLLYSCDNSECFYQGRWPVKEEEENEKRMCPECGTRGETIPIPLRVPSD